MTLFAITAPAVQPGSVTKLVSISWLPPFKQYRVGENQSPVVPGDGVVSGLVGAVPRAVAAILSSANRAW